MAATDKSSWRVFGVYYDDPEKVSKHQCRYIVGAIVAEGNGIDNQNVDSNRAVAHFESNGFKQMILPKIQHALYTTFPFRCGWLSILLAVAIVYKALGKVIDKAATGYDADRGIMELYEKDVIHFVYHMDLENDKLMAAEFKRKSS